MAVEGGGSGEVEGGGSGEVEGGGSGEVEKNMDPIVVGIIPTYQHMPRQVPDRSFSPARLSLRHAA